MPPGEPDTTAVLTVMLAVPPGLTDWLAGDRLSEKSLWPVQDWVEEFAVTRSAPPVVLTLFCTQYPATVLNRTSVGLPVPRWAVRWSKVIPLESRDSRQEVLTLQEVAEWLKITPRQIQRLGIPYFNLGDRPRRYLAQDVREWLARRRENRRS